MNDANRLVRAGLLGLSMVVVGLLPIDSTTARDQSTRVGHQQRSDHAQYRNGGHRRSGSLRVQDPRQQDGLSSRHYDSRRSGHRVRDDDRRAHYEYRRYDPPRHYDQRPDRHDGRHYNRHPDYYRPPSHRVHRPPHYHYPIYVGGLPYYYYSGYFYRPYHDNYWVSVVAPIGARVGALPAGYISLGYGGHNYYYLNATWFLYDRPAREYVVVEPPPGVVTDSYAGGTDYDETAELFVHPSRGQSDEQTQRDRYECHLWAVSQTGVDPSVGDTDDRERADYRRALTACLEGRGYTVR